jgi:hypothetical protein
MDLDFSKVKADALKWGDDRAGKPGIRGGFTLIEAALTTMIVGVGFLAMLQLFTACTMNNAHGNHVTAAQMLANNAREMMQGIEFNDPITKQAVFGPEVGETLDGYDDLDDFDGARFNPPLDSTRQELPQLSQYTQVISVMPVDENQPSINANESAPALPKTAYTGAVRVRVRVLYAQDDSQVPQEVYRAQWIRLDR